MSSRVCLDLTDEGQIAIPLQLATGPRRAAVRVRCCLDTAQGSWLDDVRRGIPAVDWMEPPAPSPAVVEGVIRSQLVRLREPMQIESVQTDIRGGVRRVQIRATITANGSVVMLDTPSTLLTQDDAPGAWYRLLVERD